MFKIRNSLSLVLADIYFRVKSNQWKSSEAVISDKEFLCWPIIISGYGLVMIVCVSEDGIGRLLYRSRRRDGKCQSWVGDQPRPGAWLAADFKPLLLFRTSNK